MKQKWKKKLCGAISIFLCIIFVSNYVLIALLVDSARMRMAKSIAEGSLDTAASSVMSYYNQMLYDLYGLFSTDSLTEEQIVELLNDYTQKTLGILELDESSLKSLTDAIEDTLESVSSQGELADFDLYDFETQVELVEGDSTTLANTDAVESQIIDHMKYRAPYAMASEVGGFLEKMGELFTIKERIQLTMDKLNITKSKESMFEEVSKVQEDIAAFETQVKEFLAAPTGDAADGTDPYTIVAKIDDAFREVAERMESQKPTEPQPPTLSGEEEDAEKDKEAQEKYEQEKAQYQQNVENFRNRLKEEYQKSLNTVLEKCNAIKQKANAIADSRNALYSRWNNAVQDYQNYVKELEGKLEPNKDVPNYQTVYGPEIQQAKGACGQLIQRGNILIVTNNMAANIATQIDAMEQNVRAVAEKEIEQRLEGTSSSVQDAIRSGATAQQQAAKTAMESYVKILQSLQSATSISTPAPTVSLKKVDVKGNTAKEEVSVPEESEDGEELRSLKEEDLQIDFETVEDVQWNGTIEDSVDAENSAKLLGAGLNLIEKIEDVLENARDSLYINEYILAYFPNYVQHYAAKDKELSSTEGEVSEEEKKQVGNSYLIAEDRYYADFNASQAEVEYVLTGRSNALQNMADISARLLGVRMIFNCAAIFTDTSKVTLSQSMAAASGPFAPLVSVGILLAWSLAESVLDVADLLQGDEVPLFKQGADWKISAEGLVNEMVEKAANYVTTELTNAINKASEYAQQKTNEIIYNVYTGVSDARAELNEWAQQVGQEMQAEGAPGWAVDEIMGEFDRGSAEIDALVTDARDKTLAKANQAIARANEKITDTLQNKLAGYQEKAVSAISKQAIGKLPIGNGTGQSTAVAKINMNYIDYIRIFLLFCGNTTKVQRIQQLVQANMRYGGQEFSMAESYISVSSKMEGTIKFLLLSEAILPASMKKDGRMSFTVYSRMGY